jgi:hypothetical protein
LLSRFKLTLSAYLNRLRRRGGPAFRDQCLKVIMGVCSLQLERTETRELAPTGKAYGPMIISGGAITKVTYKVFDRYADAIDPKIKKESWRAFAQVIMTMTLDRDPEFQVTIEGTPVTAKDYHKAPGLELIKHLSGYFPLLPKAYTGQVYTPNTDSYEEHA